jgi:hypothetical protein
MEVIAYEHATNCCDPSIVMHGLYEVPIESVPGYVAEDTVLETERAAHVDTELE